MTNKFKPVLVELRPSKIDPNGIGAFAVVSIKSGTKVFEGVHCSDFKHLVSWSVFRKLPKLTAKKVLAFCVGTSNGFVPPDNFDFNNLSIAWYLNHSCDGNIGFDKAGDFVTIKHIKLGDELTYDYGLIESNPDFRMTCTCRSPKCRRIVTGTDWKLLKDNATKLGFMHPYLRNRE
jgi:hypothetical protein